MSIKYPYTLFSDQDEVIIKLHLIYENFYNSFYWYYRRNDKDEQLARKNGPAMYVYTPGTIYVYGDPDTEFIEWRVKRIVAYR